MEELGESQLTCGKRAILPRVGLLAALLLPAWTGTCYLPNSSVGWPSIGDLTSLSASDGCSNGIDDDGDGLIDIFDPDCYEYAVSY